MLIEAALRLKSLAIVAVIVIAGSMLAFSVPVSLSQASSSQRGLLQEVVPTPLPTPTIINPGFIGNCKVSVCVIE